MAIFFGLCGTAFLIGMCFAVIAMMLDDPTSIFFNIGIRVMGISWVTGAIGSLIAAWVYLV